jgi:malate dehydrogenase (oxaloacetate-decarboxylating)
MDDISKKALELHKKYNGKIHTALNAEINTQADLAVVYSPGVAAVSTFLQANPTETKHYTSKGTTIAVISDGSAVLGLGNIGPYGAWPVMEGKAALFKRFADVNAVPILLNTQDPDEIIKIITAIAPSFGGINLEDIAAPGCFYIEQTLRKTLDIPVIHDDQWGAATVSLAGLINAAKVVSKDIKALKVVVNGAGAAAMATVELLLAYGIKQVIVLDSKGILVPNREGMDKYKTDIAHRTNPTQTAGNLHDAVAVADVFIGLSKGNVLSSEMVKIMAKDPIIFALANPIPEIMPELAKEAGAKVIATGRSDYPNQINNSLVFPGMFKGLLESGKVQVQTSDFIRAAEALASMVEHPTFDKIVPTVFDDTASVIAKAIR